MNNRNQEMIQDFGKRPLIINIDKATKLNRNFRTALWTGTHMQVTLMSIPVGGEIGLEMHPNIDQFIRIEEGCAFVMMGKSKNCLNYCKHVDSNYAIIIPHRTWHNIINTSKTPLKLYSIYAPPQHSFGTIHRTIKEAQLAEK